MKPLWSAVIAIGMAGAARAQGDDEKAPKGASSEAKKADELDRIKKLEEEVERLKKDREGPKADAPRMSLDGDPGKTLEAQDKKEPPKPSELEFKASFTDGLHFRSTDGNFDFHVGGRVLEEYRYVYNRPHVGGNPVAGAAAVRSQPNTFYLREFFVTLDGTLFHDWGFLFNGDFSPQGSNATNGGGSGALAEVVYLEYKRFKECTVLFGTFKEPVSMDTTDSPRFSETIQRATISRFMPNVEIGAMVYGSFLDSLFTYQLAVVDGRNHLNNAGRNLVDDNTGKEYAGRLTAAPFVQDKESFLKRLRVGVYGSIAYEGEDGLNPQGWPGGLATAELNTTYLVFPGGFRFHGRRNRVGGELTYAYGPFEFRGEVMERSDEFQVAATGQVAFLRTRGYYGTATFLVTGEDRIPNGRTVPKKVFDPSEGGWGALELVARFGAVSLDKGALDALGVDFVGTSLNGRSSNRVSSLTLGFNWWPIQNVRIAVNYVGENYYRPVDFVQSGDTKTHLHGVLAHFQIDF